MRPRAVTVEQIIDAADKVARRDGIEGITIRKLCAELGVTAPAVYGHFSSRDLIVEQLVDHIVARTELPGPEAGDWVERMRICFVSVHDELTPYAGLAGRMSKQLPMLNASTQRNALYLDDLLTNAGVDRVNSARIRRALGAFTWGHLLTCEAVDMHAPTSREQFSWGLEHLLDAVRREFVPSPLDQDDRTSNHKPRRPGRPTRSVEAEGAPQSGPNRRAVDSHGNVPPGAPSPFRELSGNRA